MRKLKSIMCLGVLTLALTGCDVWTKEDLAQCKAMIKGEQEVDLRLDANHDGRVSPADYVKIKKALQKMEESEKANDE